jgi:hypothetical protein
MRFVLIIRGIFIHTQNGPVIVRDLTALRSRQETLATTEKRSYVEFVPFYLEEVLSVVTRIN